MHDEPTPITWPRTATSYQCSRTTPALGIAPRGSDAKNGSLLDPAKTRYSARNVSGAEVSLWHMEEATRRVQRRFRAFDLDLDIDTALNRSSSLRFALSSVKSSPQSWLPQSPSP